MSKIIAITGNRRTGKTHKAINTAKQIGLPFCVLVPRKFLHEYRCLFAECAVVPIEADCRGLDFEVLVILEASHVSHEDFERTLGSAGTIIVEGNLPAVQSRELNNGWSWLAILDLPFTKHIELKSLPNRFLVEGDSR